MKLSANCCTEAASSSVPSWEAEVVFQQDGARALYGEYITQCLNTILLYLRRGWDLVIGYLAPLQVKYISKSKVIRLYIV